LKGELVRTWTEDGFELQGLFCEPVAPERKTAVLHLHGATSNFYRSHAVDALAEAYASRGYWFLTANTRGHDIVNILATREPNRGQRMGNAYERFTDCVLDIGAWLGCLENRGWNRVVLEGHSFGAMKSAYYLGTHPDARIVATVLLSPGEHGFFEKHMGHQFAEARQKAEEWIAQGQPDQLVPVGTTSLISARNLAAGVNETVATNVFNFANPNHPWAEIGAIRVPILVVFGTVGEYITVPAEQACKVICEKAVSSPRCDWRVFEGAPHNYKFREAEVAGAVGEWVVEVAG